MTQTKNWTADQIQDQAGRVVIVTGSTSGIGEEAARVLAGKNATVVMAVRNTEKGVSVADTIRSEFPSSDVRVLELDLSDLGSVRAFADRFAREFDRLDVLINNAGVMMPPYSKTTDGFEIQMGTNHLGHFALTGQLLDLLQAADSSRIVNVSSLAHRFGEIDFDDLAWASRDYNTQRAYGDSKIANLYFTHELAKRLGDSNPLAVAAHPGWTATDLQRHSGLFSFLNPIFAQTPAMGALPTLRAGFDHEVTAGEFYGPARFGHWRGYPVAHEPNELSRNGAIAERLWEVSEDLTGIDYSI